MRRRIGVDTETFRFRPGCMAPPLVCLSYHDGQQGGVLSAGDALEWFRGISRAEDVVIVGHNISYDLAVLAAADPTLLEPIFSMLAEDRVEDTMIRQQLIDIAQDKFSPDTKIPLEYTTVGRYSLAGVVHTVFRGKDISEGKVEDSWRLRYQELFDVPVKQWPKLAYDYAYEDAVWAYEIARKQDEWDVIYTESLNDIMFNKWRRPGQNDPQRLLPVKIASVLADQYRQVRAAMSLHLMSVWGVRTDEEKVLALKGQLQEALTEAHQQLVAAGIYVQDKKGVWKVSNFRLRECVAASCERMGQEVPKTEKGRISITRGVLAQSDDVNLQRYGNLSATRKLLSTYIPALLLGVRQPMHVSYYILVRSGRTSCREPNLQNPPRFGGIRECFVARPGMVFVFCDYDTAELRGFAQTCLDLLGFSRLAEEYRADPSFDPHAQFAASMVGIPYREAIGLLRDGDAAFKLMRQQSKAANFGFPGGLGARTFVGYAQGYGVTITLEQAQEIRQAWFEQWPEAQDFFNYVGRLTKHRNTSKVLQLRSERVRGGVTFTSGCNTYFQGIIADTTKYASFLVARESYSVPSSPLYGCRPWLFMHDELGAEVPEERVHEAAMRLRELMLEAMARYLPDVPGSASPVACRQWRKEAKPVYVEGRLVPWEEAEAEVGRLLAGSFSDLRR